MKRANKELTRKGKGLLVVGMSMGYCYWQLGFCSSSADVDVLGQSDAFRRRRSALGIRGKVGGRSGHADGSSNRLR